MNKSNDQKKTFEGFPVHSDAKGYKIMWLDGKDVKVHVFVWERSNGPKPVGHDIHHIDFDKGNYSLDNLELLSYSDHKKLHAGWIKTNNDWSHKPCTECLVVLPLSDFYPRKGHTPSAKCKPCHCKQTAVWQSNNIQKTRKIKLDYYYRNKKTGGKK